MGTSFLAPGFSVSGPALSSAFLPTDSQPCLQSKKAKPPSQVCTLFYPCFLFVASYFPSCIQRSAEWHCFNFGDQENKHSPPISNPPSFRPPILWDGSLKKEATISRVSFLTSIFSQEVVAPPCARKHQPSGLLWLRASWRAPSAANRCPIMASAGREQSAAHLAETNPDFARCVWFMIQTLQHSPPPDLTHGWKPRGSITGGH